MKHKIYVKRRCCESKGRRISEALSCDRWKIVFVKYLSAFNVLRGVLGVGSFFANRRHLTLFIIPFTIGESMKYYFISDSPLCEAIIDLL